IYRILYIRGYNTTQAMEIIETEFKVTQERDDILSFIRKSDRGVMRGYIKR
ncbi:MAG: acyl-[acyl-carrier-protein]--UDP-N-acetylglucosamine O-acyltransferase, partial [Bacteroidetes bacterium]|nr:acyl-[acyl-carrier-protein]--UDP-N-acetylglucosamine O-acyltransferase [Bacteroidota bacterium]